ncbi:MAG: DUF1415 domain-containing protein [Chitinophagaceae bacterium]|nr:DUF1415 domain-containing protein [Chitinophagaceae bacterium]
MQQSQQVIDETKKWINEVVIGCNFCPFAAKVVKQQKVHYQVEKSLKEQVCLEVFLKALVYLDDNENIETSFLIFSHAFSHFADYLHLVDDAEMLLQESGYEGIYQVASFHPNYLFAGAKENDAANYTNRSIYPMLHLIRETSIDEALVAFKNPDAIPQNNINFAQQKGLVYMQMLRDSCKNQ